MLSVGAIYTVGPYLFPGLVSRLQQLAPKMPLFIEENYTASLRGKLSRGELDAIFVALPFTETDVVTRTLYDEPFVVLLPTNHVLAGQAQIDSSALASHRVLLMGEGHCFRDQVLEACPGLQQAIRENYARGHMVVEGSSLETLKHMVASGLGITVLPQSAAREATYGEQTLAVRPFADPAPKRSIALAWRVSYPRPEAIDILIDALRPQ
jgi:LysR family hydrogen peroxide-inducible transcriptional activator